MGTFPVQQAQTWDDANPSEYALLKDLVAKQTWLGEWQADLSKKMDRIEAAVTKVQEDVLIIKRLLMSPTVVGKVLKEG